MKTPAATPARSLVAEGLVHGYGEGPLRRAVLQGLSLEFQSGRLCLVMGASGSGKSTLLAALSGLLRPDAGRVTALGCELWSLPPSRLEAFRFRHFGFIFQGFNLFSALTALEQVALPLRYAGMERAASVRRATEALEEVGLGARASLRPAQLSGGEKQRVAIARALAGNPGFLFADEPTSALDRENGERVMELLSRITRSHGATVIVVSHDPHLVRHADRRIELVDGRVLSDGAVDRATAREVPA